MNNHNSLFYRIFLRYSEQMRGCIQKFPKWHSTLPLCAVILLFCESVCRHNPLCCFSTSVYLCKRIFRYRHSPENFGYTLVCTILEFEARNAQFININQCRRLFGWGIENRTKFWFHCNLQIVVWISLLDSRDGVIWELLFIFLILRDLTLLCPSVLWFVYTCPIFYRKLKF
jgi:hypothetical protein